MCVCQSFISSLPSWILLIRGIRVGGQGVAGENYSRTKHSLYFHLCGVWCVFECECMRETTNLCQQILLKENQLFWLKSSQELSTNFTHWPQRFSCLSEAVCVYTLYTLYTHTASESYWKLSQRFGDIDGKPTAPTPLSCDHSHFRRKPWPTQLFYAFQNKLTHSITPPLISQVSRTTNHFISLDLQPLFTIQKYLSFHWILWCKL